MTKLQREYKTQLEIIKQRLQEIEKEIENVSTKVSEYDPYLNDLRCRYYNLDYFKRNLMYAINWMQTGNEVGKYNGIQNVKVSEKYC